MRWIATGMAAALGAVACSGSSGVDAADGFDAMDGAVDVATDMATVDGSADGASGATVARGEYIVRHLAACGDCHTPRDANGDLDMTRWLAGVPNEFDLVPSDPTTGGVSAPNLTPDMATGLGGWTDDDIRRALTNGLDDQSAPLVPIMPYWLYHNMNAVDVDSIVMYLRSIPAVPNAIPDRQPLAMPLTAPASPLPDSVVPHTMLDPSDPNYAVAEQGRYLAETSGCVSCHTLAATSGDVPVDTTQLFGGNRPFAASDLGLPVPPYPATIYSENITPAPNGIGGWSPLMVQSALRTGQTSLHLCPPMPSGPNGAYGGMTADDALAIGNYLTSIPAVDTGPVMRCFTPTGDGGQDAASDAGGDAGGDADGGG